MNKYIFRFLLKCCILLSAFNIFIVTYHQGINSEVVAWIMSFSLASVILSITKD